MTITDYFNLLDLPTGSSVDEIKKAYRKKARLYHPDINPGPEAKDKFIIITEAYDFLISNYEKLSQTKDEYDQAEKKILTRRLPWVHLLQFMQRLFPGL